MGANVAPEDLYRIEGDIDKEEEVDDNWDYYETMRAGYGLLDNIGGEVL